MADRFNRLDNTAPVVDVAENEKVKVDYSYFNLKCKEIGQALPYALIPIDCIEMFPNSEITLNYDLQVTFRNPTLRKILNGFRVYLHAYYNRYSDLWEGWNNFITRGRSGTESLEIPHIQTRLLNVGKETKFTPFTPMSLYDYLGYPPEAVAVENEENVLNKFSGVKLADLDNYTSTNLANYSTVKISALKAMMYQRLWRDKYAPKNLLQNNTKIYPKNEDHFILSYEATEVGKIDYGQEKFTIGAAINTWNNKGYYVGANNISMRIDCLRFRQFQGDRFTTASPFSDMLRGTAPNMTLTINSDTLSVKIPENTVLGGKILATAGASGQIPYTIQLSATTNGTPTSHSTSEEVTGSADFKAVVDEDKVFGVEGTTITSAIKLKDLRSLEVFTIFAERMARCDGNYNSLIKAQYGYNPKSEEREAQYIGGSYQDISLNSIYQTSQSSGSDKLGQQVAQGVSASYNKLGTFHSHDYGMVMVIMSIVPETIYTTGISKKDTAITFEEQYYPLFNNLSAEPILNKELFLSGNETTDNDLYGYAERFSEYKSRRNKVKGFSQLPSTINAYDSALVMARKFNTTPSLNANFVTGYPDAYSLESFASTEEPPFDYAIIKDVEVRYPMPYASIPEGLGVA